MRYYSNFYNIDGSGRRKQLVLFLVKSLATQATYLGHVINQYGVATDLEKVPVVSDWPASTNLKESQVLVGNTLKVLLVKHTLSQS